MRHVDPDTLALLALGEEVAGEEERIHLAECAACSADVATLQRAATVGRSTMDAGSLLEPAPRVWNRISAELGFDSVAPAPPDELEPRRRRWVPVAAVAVAAAVAVVSAISIGIWQLAAPTRPTVLATATLDAFPEWPDATGAAVVKQLDERGRVVQVTLDAVGIGDRYTEVWLISSDATRLVSLGTLTGESGTLPIPDGVDLSVYDLVDVSAEPYDGDPTHSGNSIVRGQLS